MIGVKKGDEVITPPNSFISSTTSIAHVGAKPVFADVLKDQNIDPRQIEKKITKKTKAIMPVHLTGRVCEMNPIQKISNKYIQRLNYFSSLDIYYQYNLTQEIVSEIERYRNMIDVSIENQDYDVASVQIISFLESSEPFSYLYGEFDYYLSLLDYIEVLLSLIHI